MQGIQADGGENTFNKKCKPSYFMTDLIRESQAAFNPCLSLGIILTISSGFWLFGK